MRDLIRMASAAAMVLSVAACDPDPVSDAGTSDAGADAADVTPDAGQDGGDLPDAGPPCSGPPGLYETGSCTVLAQGVRPFTPRYELWADDADKERYIFLPAGSRIDTSDPDNWIFPTGTRIYKTFLLDGVRLETRLLEKRGAEPGPSGWDMIAYAWNARQDRVENVTDFGRENVLGTEHDVPSGSDCVDCHRGARDVVNGFSAIQLNHDGAGVTLDDLLTENLLTAPIARADADVPGASDTVTDGLGYLHANCGHCHRYTQYDTTVPPECTQMDGRCGTCLGPACATGLRMWLRVGYTTPEETDTYVTSIGRRGSFIDGAALCRIHPGEPSTSTMIVRMNARGDFSQMPPLATEQVHAAGVTAVEAFIAGLAGPSTDCVP